MKLQERSFEIARKVVCEEINGEKVYTTLEEPAFDNVRLPEYSTSHSAGADFFCAKEVTIPSIWSMIFSSLGAKAEDKASKAFDSIMSGLGYTRKEADSENDKKADIVPTVVHTGIKANMFEDEVLEIYNRSSNPKKLGLILANSVGVIDADYFESEESDGEIMFAYFNFKPWSVTLKVGDKVGQGVFKKVLRPTKGLVIKNDTRKGGFGSTDEKVN